MIRLLLRLLVVLLFAVPLAWLGVLGQTPDPDLAVGAVFGDLERAYPESQERGRVVEESTRLAQGAARVLLRLGTRGSPRFRAGLVVWAVHGTTLARIVPLLFAVAASGFTGGLIFRERMRTADGYASPTAAGIARALVAAGLVGLGLFGLTPIEVDFAWIYGALGAVTLGALIYAANLPLQI